MTLDFNDAGPQGNGKGAAPMGPDNFFNENGTTEHFN